MQRIFAQPTVTRRVSAMDGANEPQHAHIAAPTKSQFDIQSGFWLMV